MEIRSRRPALLDAHDADSVGSKDWRMIDSAYAIATK